MRLFAACYGAADTLAHRDHEEQQDARHHEIAEIAVTHDTMPLSAESGILTASTTIR